jgi:cytoskeletal protein CcmA (bactofilin family)
MIAEKADQNADGSILIGANVAFKGEVTVPGSATVNGKFEGTLNAKDLFIGQSGQVSGQISADNADIRGTVKENLAVQSKLTLRASGSISGSVSYSKIIVEEGGVLAGKIEQIGKPRTATEAAEPTDPKVFMLQRPAE